MEYLLSDQSTGISKLLVKYKLLNYRSLQNFFVYWLLRMRNIIFNVVSEFGDVKETTTKGDNTCIGADKPLSQFIKKVCEKLAAIPYKLIGRPEQVSGFLLHLNFPCNLSISHLLSLDTLPYLISGKEGDFYLFAYHTGTSA